MNSALSDLHTGNSGIEQTFGNEEISDEQKEAIEEQKLELGQLLPGVDYIKAICQEEIDTVSDIRSYITDLGSKASKDAVQAEYRARELYITFIENLVTSIDDRVIEVKKAAEA